MMHILKAQDAVNSSRSILNARESKASLLSRRIGALCMTKVQYLEYLHSHETCSMAQIQCK